LSGCSALAFDIDYNAGMTQPTQQEQWFERVWTDREETIYRKLFGDIGTTIHTIPPALFAKLGQQQIDPRWPTHGVFECPATAARANWLYVTSGLSNPWGMNPDDVKPGVYSGLGFEFLLQTPERAPWAISVLHWLMAIQILVASGLLKGHLVELYDRIPLGASIDPKQDSVLRNLILTEPESVPATFELESGRVDLLLCVGISNREKEFAQGQGGPGLVTLLKHHGIFPLTDARRRSVI
jgi:hypothetical protein